MSVAMLGLVILLVIVGSAAALFTILLLKGMLAPRKVEALARLLKQGKTRQVIAASKRLLSRDPRSPDARYLLGLSYLKEDRPELALIEFRAINTAGVFTGFCAETGFRQRAAELYDRFGHVEEALKEYLLLLKSDPGNAEYSFHVGELFEKRGDPEKAAGFYTKAAKLRPTHAESFARLGCLHYRAKRSVEAKRALEAATKLDPGNCTASFYLARILREGGDARGAQRLLERAARDPTLRAKALLESGSCSLAVGDHDRAISDLQRAIRASGGEPEGTVLYARYFLGLVYEKTRDFDKAVEQWELVRAVKPAFRDVGQKLTEYQALRHDDAMKDYLTAGAGDFTALCRQIIEPMSLEVTSAQDIPDGCELQGLQAPAGMVQRRMSHLLRFLRPARPVDEASVRSFLERMKSLRADRGLIASSAGFSRRAVAFAQTRPLELISRDRLSALLKEG